MPKFIENGSRVFTQEVLNDGKLTKPKYRHYSDLKACFPKADSSVTKVIAMSDIHSVTSQVVDSLIKKGNIDSSTIVICTGDMAGNGRSGPSGDCNPYDDYVKILKAARAFYFVQGNHDIYDERALKLMNSDGTPCCVHGRAIKTPIGVISGLNGITNEVEIKERHKYTNDKYKNWVKQIRKMGPIDIFLTHQPFQDNPIAPLHLFGHAHAKKFYTYNGQSLMLNLDSRLVLFT